MLINKSAKNNRAVLRKYFDRGFDFYYRMRGKTIVHFIHISKTGGTAIKHALQDFVIGDKYIIRLHRHNYSLKDVPRHEKAIFFLRNPVDRYVSGFNCRQREGQPRFHFPHSPEEATAYKVFSTTRDLAESLSSDDDTLKKQASEAMTGIRHLRRLVRQSLGNKAYIESRLGDILYIGFQESLSKDFERLKTILELPSNLSLPRDPVNAHKRLESDDVEMSDEARRNVEDWYADDVEIYGYCKELAARINAKYVQA